VNRDFFKNVLDTIQDGVYFVDSNRQITFWNKGAERLSGYTSAEVQGRNCADNILRHMTDSGLQLCRAQCPLAKTLLDGELREGEVFLHHKQGHRVPVTVRIAPMFDEAGGIVGAVEIFSETTSRQTLLNELNDLKDQTLRDPLTGLGNRRAAHDEFHRRLRELQRYRIPFGILFIDIDHFKPINDTYGHEVGDSALIMLSKTMTNALRSVDTVCRWGGEEFIAIIPKVEQSVFRIVAERVRCFVEASALPLPAGELKLTVSVGGAMAKSTDTLESILARADAMMYKAKRCGRNCTELDCDAPTPEHG